jgi:hypothetical protein
VALNKSSLGGVKTFIYLGKTRGVCFFFVGYIYKWLVVELNPALVGKHANKLVSKDVSKDASKRVGDVGSNNKHSNAFHIIISSI